MERIYFDKQIFSHLFKREKTKYKRLLDYLNQNKEMFLFCYSHSHLLDLKNDKTNIKYRELEFMETLVKDNYLSYHAINKRTICYLAKPLEVFRDIEENDKPISFTNLFDNIDLSSATDKQKKHLENAKDLFYNQRLDFGFSQIGNLPDNIPIPLKKVLPIEVSSMTLMEWTEHFMNIFTSIEEDKAIYKELRNTVDKYVNNGKFLIEYDEIDFNKDLKNSVLQKSFIEYVNNNLNPNGDKEITDYDFYINAYFNLDLLGLSKEASKTVKFKNIMNDGYHSYYGAFCDYVVSGDQGFLKKTKVMYKLLDIKTEVMHIDDFIPFFILLSKQIEISPNAFFELLTNDLKNGIILNSKPSIKYNRHTITIKPHHKYLGYFNLIDNIQEDNQNYIYLYCKTKNYSYFVFLRECEGIINKAIKIFGIDYYNKSEFNWNIEIQEIKNGEWKGRLWNFSEFTILIEINKGTRNLGLLITPKKNSE